MASLPEPPLREGKPFLNSEILLRILVLVHEDTTPAGFLPCLRVCQSFFRLALPIFHGIMTLTDSNLRNFVLSAGSSSPKLKISTQALTVRIKGCRPGKTNPTGLLWKLDELFCRLAAIIKGNMPALRSFSLHIDDQMLEGKAPGFDEIWSPPNFHAASVIELIDALPQTCTALEIDTSGFEIYRGHEHLCPHIAHMLPRLEHLRVRAGQICPAFINPPYHMKEVCYACPLFMRPPISLRLRTLVFSMELSPWVPVTKRCPWSPAVYREPHSVHLEMARFLRGGYVNLNYFPVAERLDIYAKVFVQRSLEWLFRRTDLRNYVTSLSGFIPLLPNLDLHATPAQSWRCIRKADGGDIIAPHSRAREVGEEAWRSTVNGSRLPICEEFSKFSVHDGYYLCPRWEEPYFKGNFLMFRNQQQTIRSQSNTDALDATTYWTNEDVPNLEYPWPWGADIRPLQF